MIHLVILYIHTHIFSHDYSLSKAEGHFQKQQAEKKFQVIKRQCRVALYSKPRGFGGPLKVKVPPEPGTSPKINELFPGPLSSLTEICIKIRTQLFELFC